MNALAAAALGSELAPPMTADGKRLISVRYLLEWVFGTEHASIDDDRGGPPSVSTIWLMVQRGNLGCKIDGGGRSLAHDDAEVIAAVVSTLPPEMGGRRMAIRIAELARSGRVPDSMPEDHPRCVPVAMRQKRDGTWEARTDLVQTITTYHGRRRARTKFEVRCCPVTWSPTAAEIGAARRAYLAWWSALLHLRVELSRPGLLSRFVVTDAMPPLTPWLDR